MSPMSESRLTPVPDIEALGPANALKDISTTPLACVNVCVCGCMINEQIRETTWRIRGSLFVYMCVSMMQ